MSNELQRASAKDMQMMPIAEAQAWYMEFVNFSKSILKAELDYGTIPGTGKPSLYKPGAEKLRFVYGLTTESVCTDKTCDINKPFIDYSYKCTVKTKGGQILAECEGSCNSLEPKFGYVWKTIGELPEGTDISNLQSKTTGKKMFEFEFALTKRETTGNYGKPIEYWNNWDKAIESGKAKQAKKKTKTGKEMAGFEMDDTVTVYRVQNPDVVGMKNTIMKMAQKRAFVGAILLATGASEFFTQDIEDMEFNGQIHSNGKPTFEEAEVIEEKKPEIPGAWIAKAEKCKTKDDVDKLIEKNKATVDAHPNLKEYLLKHKEQIEELPFP